MTGGMRGQGSCEQLENENMNELPHVYRNWPDDDREPEDLKYCATCNGFYHVRHEMIHEYPQEHPEGGPRSLVCSCRPCRELEGLSREGRYGFILSRNEATRLLPAT